MNDMMESIATPVELHVIILTKVTHADRDEQELISVTQTVWKLSHINSITHQGSESQNKEKNLYLKKGKGKRKK